MTDLSIAEATEALLAPDEPPAFEVLNGHGQSTTVLVCDHASHRIPRRLGTLGLSADQLLEHIAWDPGAAEVARSLSASLDTPLILSGYSRLVIDCNRPLESPESIAARSAGVPVPGNRGLTPEDRDLRVAALFRPYHLAIERILDSRIGRPSLLLSLHSFTPILDGQQRPWPIAVSYGRDRRLADLFLPALARYGTFPVGDNEPYPVEDAYDFTLPTHGERRGIPHIMIEIRQDGLSTATDRATWAVRLAETYRLVEAEALALVAAP
jgi:predicted N-formylglutamate amidohydrolase